MGLGVHQQRRRYRCGQHYGQNRQIGRFYPSFAATAEFGSFFHPAAGAAHVGLMNILLCGGTDSIIQVFPPMVLPCPTTVSPPRMVAPA